jgi:hypothetical protein
VTQMTPEEKETYIAMGQRMFEDLFEWNFAAFCNANFKKKLSTFEEKCLSGSLSLFM